MVLIFTVGFFQKKVDNLNSWTKLKYCNYGNVIMTKNLTCNVILMKKNIFVPS